MDTSVLGQAVLGELVLGSAGTSSGPSFTLRAVLQREQSGSFTLNATIVAPGSGSFTLDAVISIAHSGSFDLRAIKGETSALIVRDPFDRNVTNGWGRAPGGKGRWHVLNDDNWPDASSLSVVAADHEGLVTDTDHPILAVEHGAYLKARNRRNLTVTVLLGVKVGSPTNPWKLIARVLLRHDGQTGFIGHFSSAYYALDVLFNWDGSVSLSIRSGNDTWVVNGVATSFSWATGDRFFVEFRAARANPTHLKARIWREGGAKPWRWNIRTTDSGGPQVAGYLGLSATTLDPSTRPIVYDFGFIEAYDLDYSFDLDAVIQASQVGSFTLDAILRAPRAGSFTLDAHIHIPGVETFQLDAVLHAQRVGSFALDATLSVPRAGSFSLDAHIHVPGVETLQLDAILRREQAHAFGLDAILHATRAGSFTLDAVLRSPAIGASFELDAVVRRVEAHAFTLSAVITAQRAGSFTLAAIVRRTASGTVVLSARLRATVAGAFTLSAVIEKTVTTDFTLEALISVTRMDGFSLSAAISASRSGSFPLAAVIQGTGTDSFALWAYITTNPPGFVAPAQLVGDLTPRLLDSVLDVPTRLGSALTPRLLGFGFGIPRTRYGSFTLDAILE